MADEVIAAETTEPEQTTPPHGGKPTMSLKVYAPFKVYFEGDVFSLSAVNGSGPFDILPRHHNFICMLLPCDLAIKAADGRQLSVKVRRALMHVKADHVTVFMDV